MALSESLKGKVAVVTGGARGLGVNMAHGLAEAGAHVAITYRSSEATAKEIVEEIEAKYHVTCRAYYMEVTDADKVQATIAKIHQDFKSIDIFVANAGISIHGNAETFSLADWKSIFDVNVNGVFYGIQAASRYMLEEARGSIVAISSISARIANFPQAQTAYNASKASVSMMVKCMAVEWATRGVRVNAICPGYMSTDMLGDFFKQNPDLEQAWINRIPMRRLGNPDELKGAIVFLAGDQSSYVTGSELFVDGGYTAV